MEGEWYTLHHIEKVSNLISLLREYEKNTLTRNAMRCNNRDDLLNLSLILKISIFSEVGLPSLAYMLRCFFCKNSQWVLIPGVIQKNNLGVGRGESSKPNPSEVSSVQLRGLGGRGCCKLPQPGVFGGGAPSQKLFGFLKCLAFYSHLVVLFFLFYFYFLYVLFLRALKNL